MRKKLVYRHTLTIRPLKVIFCLFELFHTELRIRVFEELDEISNLDLFRTFREFWEDDLRIEIKVWFKLNRFFGFVKLKSILEIT
jgi:hypothetical protein